MRIIPFLSENLNVEAAAARRLIDKKRVFCDGVVVAGKGASVKGEITVTLFEEQTARLTPLIAHRDFAIYEKPSGLLVHPQRISTEHTLLDDIKSRYGSEANIVHRIDRETSGLVLAATHKKSERFFKIAFDEKRIEKSYLAYVKGHVDKAYRIDAPILKFRDVSSRFFPISEEGRESLTLVEPLRYFPEQEITLVKAVPVTGRTHQIRIHLWHIGHPIVGEPLYGNPVPFREAYLENRLSDDERLAQAGAMRLMLHAQWLRFSYDGVYSIGSKIGFDHPETLWDAMKSVR